MLVETTHLFSPFSIHVADPTKNVIIQKRNMLDILKQITCVA